MIALRRALRAKRVRPRQALGLTKDIRERLLAACPRTPRRPARPRDDRARLRHPLPAQRACRLAPRGHRAVARRRCANLRAAVKERPVRRRSSCLRFTKDTKICPRGGSQRLEITVGPIVRAVRSEGAIGQRGAASVFSHAHSQVNLPSCRSPCRLSRSALGPFNARRRRPGHDRRRSRRAADHAGRRLAHDECRRPLRRERKPDGAAASRSRRQLGPRRQPSTDHCGGAARSTEIGDASIFAGRAATRRPSGSRPMNNATIPSDATTLH